MIHWLRSRFLQGRVDREMREEMAEHVARATERMMARGMSKADARRAALREFGNEHYLQEQGRDARGGRWVGYLGPDGKLALRMLVKHPGLTVVGGLGLAVAIAIATGFFTFLTFYYSDPPIEEGDRVVTVEWVDGDLSQLRAYDFRVWQAELSGFEDLAAYRIVRNVNLTSGASAKVVEMTAAGFRVARVPPLVGRPLLDSDEVEGAPPVLVIGYREWQEEFGGDPAVVGTEVLLEATPFTVVGVMPDGFRLPANDGYWTAMRLDASPAPGEGPTMWVFGRLAQGVEAARAQAEAAAIGERMRADYPQIYGRARLVVLPYIRHLLDVQQYPAWVVWLMQLFAASILILVAVNVAVLVYARTAVRAGEIAVRTALGAARSRIVTQLFLEGLALTGAAAVLGLMVAQIVFREMTTLIDLQASLPYWLFGGLPAETILYAAGLAVVGAVVVGVLPALQATGPRLQTTLRELGGGSGLQLGRTWTVLICVQLAVAVGILPAVVGTAWNRSVQEPTFSAAELLSFRLQRPALMASAPVAEPDYARVQAELIERVEQVPGVTGVTFASGMPLAAGPDGAGASRGVRIEVEGTNDAVDTGSAIAVPHYVDPSYFDVMGVSMLTGRPFTRGDLGDSSRVVIVSRSFVQRFLPDQGAVGRRFRQIPRGESAGPWLEIVGVVENLIAPARRGSWVPETYRPAVPGNALISLAARTNGIDPITIAPRVRALAQDVAHGHNVTISSMDAFYAASRGEQNSLVMLVSAVTLSVLLLSAGGITAMMSFAVTRRRQEVGVRTALGASRRHVVASIFWRSSRQLAIGVLVGAVIAALLDRVTGGAMLGGQMAQLVAFVAAIMLVTGLLATLGPALRALSIQPMDALRQE